MSSTKKVVLGVSLITLKKGERVTVPPGTEVDLPAARAEAMVAGGQASWPASAAVAAAPAAGSLEDRPAAIVAAIGKLNLKDKRNLDESGVPKKTAVEAIFGGLIATAELEAAWAYVQASKGGGKAEKQSGE